MVDSINIFSNISLLCSPILSKAFDIFSFIPACLTISSLTSRTESAAATFNSANNNNCSIFGYPALFFNLF